MKQINIYAVHAFGMETHKTFNEICSVIDMLSSHFEIIYDDGRTYFKIHVKRVDRENYRWNWVEI